MALIHFNPARWRTDYVVKRLGSSPQAPMRVRTRLKPQLDGRASSPRFVGVRGGPSASLSFESGESVEIIHPS